jgi:glutamate synthase (NADPH/NADH) large chain
MILMGASGVFVGKIALQAAGCVGSEIGRCNACNTGSCPVGICTQNPRLVRRLDVDKAAESIVNLILATDQEIRKILAQIGNSSLPIGRSDAITSVDANLAVRLKVQHAC